MIREIFLPNKIRGYYLFAQRIVGIDIGKAHISATQIYLKGRSILIEKYIEEKLETGNSINYSERATKALQHVVSQLDKFDKVHTALSSSVAIFKEIKLPFLSYDKIKMVVNYEIEPLLPFSINDAVIDFIITKQHPQESTSEILVAAVQNQHIAQHLQIVQNAGISPEIITIDLFALYGFYKRIPAYEQLSNTVLVDLGPQVTRIAYIQDGQLRFIRSINKGVLHLAKIVGDNLDMQANEAMEHIIRFGLATSSSPRFVQAIHNALTSFWQEIQFTLQSFTAQTEPPQQISKILLLGSGAEIKGISEFVSSLLHTPSQLMHATDILQDPAITIKNKTSLPSTSIISLSTAILAPVVENFNLRQGEFSLQRTQLLDKQLIVATSLLLILLSILSFHSFFQIRKLRKEARASITEALNALKNRPHFTLPLQDGLKGVKEKDLLKRAIEICEDEVKKQEAMWFAFAGPARSTFLKYLLELTSKIDKTSLGFVIESLTISEGVMKIKAHVKDHEALKILVKELKESKLFTFVSSPEETNFEMKIILAKNNQEQS
jgi:type IV pilus assembly protein PilM